MSSVLPVKLKIAISDLPPGLKEKKKETNKTRKQNEKISIFYVGGLSNMYKMDVIFQVISKLNFVKFTLCCRKKEWEREKAKYSKYLSENISIVHKSGDELMPYFEEADIASFFCGANRLLVCNLPLQTV